jgi:hypothetical protein
MSRPDEAAPALIYKEGDDIVLDGETYEDPLVAVRSKTITLTNAQIKALPTTSIEVVPAPGAGKMLMFHSAHLLCDATAGVYTNIDGAGGYMSIRYTGQGDISTLLVKDSGVGATAFSLGGLVEQAGNVRWATLTPYHAGADASYGLIANGDAVQENTGFSVRFRNYSNGDLTGGHADNYMRVTVNYSVIDV